MVGCGRLWSVVVGCGHLWSVCWLAGLFVWFISCCFLVGWLTFIFGWLDGWLVVYVLATFEFYILATFNVISGQAPTYDCTLMMTL